MANAACDKEWSSEGRGEKMEKALGKAGENEEKPNESTEQNKHRQYTSTICDYIKHLTPLTSKSINISPISLSIILGQKKKKVLKMLSLYGMVWAYS